MCPASLKEEAGEEKPLGRSRAESSLHLHHGQQINVRIIESHEVVKVGLRAVWNHGLEPAIEPLLHFVKIVHENCLSPAEGFLPIHDDAKVAGDSAVLVHGYIADSLRLVGCVGLEWSDAGVVAIRALSSAAGSGVLPIHGLEWAHLFTGIEVNLLAARGEDH